MHAGHTGIDLVAWREYSLKADEYRQQQSLPQPQIVNAIKNSQCLTDRLIGTRDERFSPGAKPRVPCSQYLTLTR
jgi:hypothetical protein